jgi:hypothetical protein
VNEGDSTEAAVLDLSSPVVLEESAASTPVLTFFPREGKYYAAWRNEAGKICVRTSPDGSEWGSTLITDHETPSAPTLGLEKHEDFEQHFLLLGWRDLNDNLRIRRTQNFLSWWDTKEFDVHLSGAPVISEVPESTNPDLFWPSAGDVKYAPLKSFGQFHRPIGDQEYELEVRPQKVIIKLFDLSTASNSQFGLGGQSEFIAWQDTSDQSIRLASTEEVPEELGLSEEEYELAGDRFKVVNATSLGGLALEQVGNYKFLAWTSEEDNEVHVARL